jgi:L-threonylcarbamoyladenylate synthase
MAVAALRRGLLVAYPTEAVYGIGCDPHNPMALRQLLHVKARDAGKGFIVIAAERAQLRGLVRWLRPEQMRAVYAGWPGPNTWILPAAPAVHPLLSGGRPTVAVRVTAHALAAALCRAFGAAIVSTSANVSGRPPLRSARAVRRRFGHRVAVVLEGPLGGQAAVSTVRDARTGKRLR